MNPRNRKQEVTTVFDGRTHHTCLCRGFRDGLPVFGWHEAPSTLLTKGQLREAGLRPNGQDPVALLVFRHVKPYARETVAPLFSVELAALKGIAAPGQMDHAMEARRTCVECGEIKEYCVPTSTRQCWTCFEIEQADRMGVAA
ncbi:RRQRL motif-containing zinc-binding protein [Amycolatopsis sp. NPDC005232]|uniref:RRQRL motif-containing zinc-binding protein n=1 Tax=Amycolatopsis sp. NPDC005232 TaxID=3157027 RepID=UPI00339F68B8